MVSPNNLVVLDYEGERVLVVKPESYEDLENMARTELYLDKTISIHFFTSDLELCYKLSTRIHKDVWSFVRAEVEYLTIEYAPQDDVLFLPKDIRVKVETSPGTNVNETKGVGGGEKSKFAALITGKKKVLIIVKHIASGQEAKFTVSRRGLVSTAVAKICSTFLLAQSSAKLFVIQAGDDIITSRTECQSVETIVKYLKEDSSCRFEIEAEMLERKLDE